jgi:hypothetical protein
MPRYVVERRRRRPMTGACTDQSLHTSGVVGSAHPPEFSEPWRRRWRLEGLSLAQPIRSSKLLSQRPWTLGGRGMGVPMHLNIRLAASSHEERSTHLAGCNR